VSKVFDALKKLKERGITILLVEQNLEAALTIADRGYLLDNGRIAFQGKPADFQSNPALKEAYLGL
jgi:branched-chain amino acid transport system ATP-binding protein